MARQEWKSADNQSESKLNALALMINCREVLKEFNIEKAQTVAAYLHLNEVVEGQQPFFAKIADYSAALCVQVEEWMNEWLRDKAFSYS